MDSPLVLQSCCQDYTCPQTEGTGEHMMSSSPHWLFSFEHEKADFCQRSSEHHHSGGRTSHPPTLQGIRMFQDNMFCYIYIYIDILYCAVVFPRNAAPCQLQVWSLSCWLFYWFSTYFCSTPLPQVFPPFSSNGVGDPCRKILITHPGCSDGVPMCTSTR